MESFEEHVEFCGEPFKEEILKKVLELKGRDYKLLTHFVLNFDILTCVIDVG